jgi:hypothetical protein
MTASGLFTKPSQINFQKLVKRAIVLFSFGGLSYDYSSVYNGSKILSPDRGTNASKKSLAGKNLFRVLIGDSSSLRSSE